MQNTGIQNLMNLDLNPGDVSRDVENFDNEISNTNQSQQKSWMIKLCFKCPVIGTCLSLDEQKKILKKAGYSTKNLSAFKIHQTLVESLENENDISTRIDTYLNRKFHRDVTKYLYLDESSFLKEWKLHFEKGEIEGLLWVAATRSDLSPSAIASIFADIHMQMHRNSEENKKARQHLAFLKEQDRELSQRLEEEIRIKRSVKKEKEELEREFTELQRAHLFLEKKKDGLERSLNELREEGVVETLRAQNCQLKTKTRELSTMINDHEKRMKSLRNQNDYLLSKLERQREANAHLRKEKEEFIQQISSLNQPDDSNPPLCLSSKRVLVVGGITKLRSFYRKLIEEKGAIFKYHDGYMHGGTNGLENEVRKADVVLCPVNCNSHNASLMVKRLSKKYGKPFHMLANSSLNTISQALCAYQEGVDLK